MLVRYGQGGRSHLAVCDVVESDSMSEESFMGNFWPNVVVIVT